LGQVFEIRMPRYPECWETCGNCASGDVFVLDVLVKAGDAVRVDDALITLETGKVSLDIPAARAGRVVEVFVAEGARLNEGDLILTLQAE